MNRQPDRTVEALDTHGRIAHTFDSITAAVQEGFTRSGISAAIHGSTKSHCGLRWRYKDGNGPLHFKPIKTYAEVLTDNEIGQRMEVLIRRYGLRKANLIAAG